MPSSFPSSPVIHEWSLKKTQIEKINKLEESESRAKRKDRIELSR